MASVPLWGKFVVSPFFVVNSGPPYNITTGLDPNHTGAATARPGLVAGPCQGAACFNLNPAPGTAIEHNYGRGPGAVNRRDAAFAHVGLRPGARGGRPMRAAATAVSRRACRAGGATD